MCYGRVRRAVDGVRCAEIENKKRNWRVCVLLWGERRGVREGEGRA